MSKREYKEIACIPSESGAVEAVITEAVLSDGGRVYSFAFMRRYRYTKNGQTVSERTPWHYGRHLDEIRELLPKVEERINVERDKALRAVG